MFWFSLRSHGVGIEICTRASCHCFLTARGLTPRPVRVHRCYCLSLIYPFLTDHHIERHLGDQLERPCHTVIYHVHWIR